MKITILRNVKLIDGEIYYDNEEKYEEKHITFSLINQYDINETYETKDETIGYVIIGSALLGKGIAIYKKDKVLIDD